MNVVCSLVFLKTYEQNKLVEVIVNLLQDAGSTPAASICVQIIMKPLKFIHITKTGGTSIENVGLNCGIKWGRFHCEYDHRWHKPFIHIEESVKKKYDWFTVVRNPYERILSEFYCKWVVPKNKNVSVEIFNETIRNNILLREQNKHSLDFHYTEQYKYIDNSYKIHIIKYENLKQEFNNLMKLYNINAKLDQYANVSTKFFSVSDLSRDSIDLINKIYEKDFILFDYQTI